MNADGQGYVVSSEDTSDKTGYAALSGESGVIRECPVNRDSSALSYCSGVTVHGGLVFTAQLIVLL